MRTHRRAVPLLAALAITACGTPRAGRVAASASTPAPSASAPAPAAFPNPGPRELTADQQVRQALDRLSFGPRPGDVERVRAMGVDRWIALQLEPERIPNDSTERFLQRFPTLAMSPAQLMQRYPLPGALLRQSRARANGRRGATPSAPATGSARSLSATDSARLRAAARASRQVMAEVATARVARAVMSERQLNEVMVDFWLNHFNVYAGKGPERYFLADYERSAIRPYALGKFRDLLGAVAKSPAMLYYLDNWQSAVDSLNPRLAPLPRAFVQRRGIKVPTGVNENYARELMELHTLGVDGGYTQQDVVNVARAFTGWSIDAPRRGGGFVFRAQLHDAGPKVVLGQKLPAGRGIEDGEEVLDVLARSPATARFIATELARRFVSDTPPASLVERAAATFTRTGGDIREVVRTIVTSSEFFSRAAYRSKIKSPFELVVSGLRAFGAPPDPTPRTALVIAWLGQPIYGKQTPNGYPETGGSWMNSGAILKRINFGLAIAGGVLPGAGASTWPQTASLATAPRAAQVDAVVRAFLGGEASPDTRRILMSGTNPLLGSGALAPDSVGAREDRDGSGALDPLDATNPGTMMVRAAKGAARGRNALGAPVQLDGLARIIGLALGSPEFQRR